MLVDSEVVACQHAFLSLFVGVTKINALFVFSIIFQPSQTAQHNMTSFVLLCR